MDSQQMNEEAVAEMQKALSSPLGVLTRYGVISVAKGAQEGHPFYGNQHTSGEGGGDKPVSVKEKQTPKFVSEFLREHTSSGKIKAALTTRTTEHLKRAVQLMEGHEDAGTKWLRDLTNEEIANRSGKDK